MALRDQPYFPFYVQDYLTDERLLMCSWQTQGIYIRIMCNLHKQDTYGAFLFKQIPKQTPEQTSKQNESIIGYFAEILCRLIPCQHDEMTAALTELLDNGVLTFDGERLYQKRMYNDGNVSLKRSEAARKGGGNPALKPKKSSKNLFKQTLKQIPEDESESEDEYKDDKKEKGGTGEKTPALVKKINDGFEEFRRAYPGTKRGYETEFKTLKKHADWQTVIPLLKPALDSEARWREGLRRTGAFCPQWPNLQTWLNQRRWEQELKSIENEQGNNSNPPRSTKRAEQDELINEILLRNVGGSGSDDGRYCEDIIGTEQ